MFREGDYEGHLLRPDRLHLMKSSQLVRRGFVTGRESLKTERSEETDLRFKKEGGNILEPRC